MDYNFVELQKANYQIAQLDAYLKEFLHLKGEEFKALQKENEQLKKELEELKKSASSNSV